MAVNVPGLPSNWRAPGVYIANSPAGGGATVGLLPTMMVGQMQASGTAAPNTPIQVFAQSDVNTLFGADSMLAQMFYYYRLNDPTGAVLVAPSIDNVSGTPASLPVTLGGTCTAAGTLSIYVNNTLTTTAVNVGDTGTNVSTNLTTSINAAVANPTFPFGVTASSTGGVTTISSIHKGISVGDLQVSLNKNGPSNGEFTPAGITVTIGSLVAGTGDPDLTTLFTNITPVVWSFLVCPYTTSTVNGQVNSLLNDLTGRWSPVEQLYGYSFNAVRGSLAGAVTYGGTVASNKHMSTLSILDAQTPTYIYSAILAGLAATNVRSNTSLPIVGLLQGADAPSLASRLRRADENVELFNGVSPIRVDGSGNPTLSRLVQNYQGNTNYLNAVTDFQVAYVDTFIRSDLENTYAQVSLLADGNPVAAGSGATTPSLILQHVWGIYLDLEAQGVVQNSKQFIAQSYVEADIQNGVVSLYLPVVVASQVYVIRILNSFS